MRAAALALLLAAGGCNPEACLAQSDLFGDLRPPLIHDCCQCLATHETHLRDATCKVAVCAPEDAGCTSPDGGPFVDDTVATIDGVPCLCAGNAASCRADLAAGDAGILITGACVRVRQGAKGPCTDACDGVLAFP